MPFVDVTDSLGMYCVHGLTPLRVPMVLALRQCLGGQNVRPIVHISAHIERGLVKGADTMVRASRAHNLLRSM